MREYIRHLWSVKVEKSIITDVEALHNWLSEVSKYGMTVVSVDLVKNKLQSIINKERKR